MSDYCFSGGWGGYWRYKLCETMSENIVRKTGKFSLSLAARNCRSAHLTDQYIPVDSPNFIEHVVLCIGLPAERHGRILNACGQKDVAGEMNRNTVSPTEASSSILKITINDGPENSQATLKTLRPHSNNNTAVTTQLSRTVEDGREKRQASISRYSYILAFSTSRK